MAASSIFNGFKNLIFTKFSENPGKMLIWTGATGWALSSSAQIGAIVFNKKIEPDKKEFLIPQECADAVVNILSFILITNSLKRLASKLVSTGKFTNTPIKEAVKKLKPALRPELGKLSTNLDNYKKIAPVYRPFKKDLEVIGSTVGAIISSNIVTPVVRNLFADNVHSYLKKGHHKQCTRFSMEDYQRSAALKFGTGMKI